MPRWDALTRDQEVLTMIRQHISRSGSAPTITEIAVERDMPRTSVARALQRLQRDGYIEIAPGRAGGIRVRSANTTLRTEDL